MIDLQKLRSLPERLIRRLPLHGLRGALQRPSKASWLLVLLAASSACFAVLQHGERARGAVQAPLAMASVAPGLPPTLQQPRALQERPPAPAVVVEGTIRRGETLSRALGRRDVSARVVHEIATGMRPVFDFRYARPGDAYRLALDKAGAILAFSYRRSPLECYDLHRAGEALVAERREPEIRVREVRLAGVVETSLYDAVEALGEKGELAHDFANIFAWDVDFSRAVHRGDEFSCLYEQRFLVQDNGEELYLGPGRVLAARYSNAEGDYEAVYFQPDERSGGYYRPDGSSVEREFLRAPLKYTRISSRYTASRLHPILKVRLPHFGIDYAAPVGTPVWAVADGTVIFRGRRGGFGKSVEIRHANGFVSYYSHLSRYPHGLAVGARVQQKQVVGYVGMTGLATGPHLDFRLKQYGKYVNPATLRTPAGDPIPSLEMARFAQTRDGLLRALDPVPLAVSTSEAL